MPQADLDSKVAAATDDDRESDSASRGEEAETPLPDYAPESFWLSKDAEYDWFDRNAFFDRKESINSHSANLNPNLHLPLHPGANSSTSSQRFSVKLKSKASIIGLPKTQKTAFAEAKNRKNGKPMGNTRLFPNRKGPTVSKPDPALIEPGSPKVSCMGRVRSKRDRNRRMRNRTRQAELQVRTSTGRSEPSDRSSLLSSLKAMFRSRRKRRSGRKDAAPPPEEESTRIVGDILERLPSKEAESLRDNSVGGGGRRRSLGERDDGGVDDAPSLGGMKRFVSGRRSDSWAGDVA